MSRLNIGQISRNFVILMLLAIFPCLWSASAKESEFALNCLECHEDIWEDGKSKSYIHKPFLKKDCILCHSANSSLLVDKQGSLKSSRLSNSHWFEFDSFETPTILVLKASFVSNLTFNREIPLPLINDLSEIANIYESKPLEINDVKVLEVNNGIFISANISWRTDRPTSSIITYGLPGGQQLVMPIDILFKIEHLETLSSLKRDQTYQFFITAEDSIGNKAKSDVFNFSTDSFFSNSAQNSVTANSSLLAPLSIENSFFRKGDRYLLNITSTELFSAILDFKEDPNYSAKADTNSDGENHIILSTEEGASFIACKKCHKGFISHHPVNVYLKKGMVNIANYPTMVGGKITCNSCHFPHASDLEFLLRKDRSVDLCLGCHKGTYYIKKN